MASVPERLDAAMVEAGFRPLYELRERALSGRVSEAGDDVGGTWRNRNLGARCDLVTGYEGFEL